MGMSESILCLLPIQPGNKNTSNEQGAPESQDSASVDAAGRDRKRISLAAEVGLWTRPHQDSAQTSWDEFRPATMAFRFVEWHPSHHEWMDCRPCRVLQAGQGQETLNIAA